MSAFFQEEGHHRSLRQQTCTSLGAASLTLLPPSGIKETGTRQEVKCHPGTSLNLPISKWRTESRCLAYFHGLKAPYDRTHESNFISGDFPPSTKAVILHEIVLLAVKVSSPQRSKPRLILSIFSSDTM